MEIETKYKYIHKAKENRMGFDIFAKKRLIMDLQFKDKFFIVCGAGSGFGRAISERLLSEGAQVLAIARTEKVLVEFKQAFPENLQILVGDISHEQTQDRLLQLCNTTLPEGIVFNAGGPPAAAFDELDLPAWDEAYRSVLRWKIELLQRLLPLFRKQKYGRLLFIESVSVKQPVENLILSNAFRMAVVGMVKTLANELAAENITLNILAPGYHDTAAMQRLFVKKASVEGISEAQAKEDFTKQIPVAKMGQAKDFASLAAWLLSPHAQYVTGQTISHDGGLVKGVFG